jgi:tRNA modification GTPase
LTKVVRSVSEGQNVIVVLNKIDLVPEETFGSRDFAVAGLESKVVKLCAKTGEGVGKLCELIAEVAAAGQAEGTADLFITSKRHVEVLSRSVDSLSQALESMDQGRTNEFLALDVRGAIQALAQITGDITSEDVLNAIFSSFCIGK